MRRAEETEGGSREGGRESKGWWRGKDKEGIVEWKGKVREGRETKGENTKAGVEWRQEREHRKGRPRERMEGENGESTDYSAMQRHAVLESARQIRAVLRSAELCDAGGNPLGGEGAEAGGGGGVERG